MKSILTFLLLALTVSLMGQDAYIEVKAESGISVFLDGSFKGKTSSDMGGLIIENVYPGSHTIKVLKDGFNPQEERISVKAGEVYRYTVRPFIPKLKITETGNTGQQEIDLKVGKLKIQSLPVSIYISIPSLGVNYNKSQDEWNVEEVPVGSYIASFKGMNKTLTDTIEIQHNQLTHLFVNIVSGKIENRSPDYNNYSGSVNSGNENSNMGYGSLNDPRDGKVYKTVQIGTQLWMAENLAYLPSVVGPTTESYTDPYHYVYGYNGISVTDAKASSNYQTYGVLYNWPAALQACPTGWHLPTDAEWTTLENYLIANVYNYDGTTTGNKIAKSLATSSGWHSYSGTGTVGNTDYPDKRNSTGFSALPGGSRRSSGSFLGAGSLGRWWSAPEFSSSVAWFRYLSYDSGYVYRYYGYEEYGFSVRCLRDD